MIQRMRIILFHCIGDQIQRLRIVLYIRIETSQVESIQDVINVNFAKVFVSLQCEVAENPVVGHVIARSTTEGVHGVCVLLGQNGSTQSR